jgi:hypothetical protein
MLKVNFYILTLFHRCFSKNTNLNWGRCYVANLYIITNISLRRPKKNYIAVIDRNLKPWLLIHH